MQIEQNPFSAFRDSVKSSVKSKESDEARDELYQNPSLECDNQNLSQKARLSSQQSFMDYHRFLADIENSHRSLNQLIDELQRNNIFYNKTYSKKSFKYHSDFHFKIQSIKPTKHFQIVSMDVTLGPFSQTLTLYNTFSNSLFAQPYSLNSTRKAKICKICLNEQKYIAKSFILAISQKQNGFRHQNFSSAIKEFFITKMMSVLRIGPRVSKEVCFDMFVSFGEITFIIEECKEIFRSFSQKDIQNLKKGLKQMHLLQILHTDIKPQNIMYSPSYQKFVFIDFGISDYRSEQPNQLTYTNFAGTYAYCSEQFKKLFQKQVSDWVNLYLNDICGLKLTINEMKKKVFWHESRWNQKDDFIENLQKEHFLEEIQMKLVLFDNKNEHNLEFPQNFVSLFCDQIMTFLYEIPLNENIRKIYQQNIEEHAKKLENFEDLKQILGSKIEFESYKGKRKWNNSEEERKKELIQKIYEQIQNQSSSKLSQKIPTLKELEVFLFDKQNDLLDFVKYESYLIEYLTFQQINYSVPLQKRIDGCKHYLKLKKVKNDPEIQHLTEKQAILTVINHILETKSVQNKIFYFRMFYKALQQLILLNLTLETKNLQQIQEFIEAVHINGKLSSTDKTEKLFMILLLIESICLSNLKVSIFKGTIKVKQRIHTCIISYQKAEKQQKDEILYNLYSKCIEFFRNKIHKCSDENSQQILEEISSLQISAKGTTRHLLSLIQQKLLTRVQKSDNVNFYKKQEQDLVDQEVHTKKELSFSLVQLLNYYFRIKEIKKVKKYLAIFDSFVQINEVCAKHFIFMRLFVSILDQGESEVEKNKKITYLCSKLNENFTLNPESIITFLLCLQNLLHLEANFMQQKIALPYELQKTKQRVLALIPSAIKMCEQQILDITFRGSKNYIYLNLLQHQIDAEIRKKLLQTDGTFNFLQIKSRLYPKTASFHKIVHINRSNFTDEDNIFIMNYDMIEYKRTKGERACKFILDYLKQRHSLILKYFSVENTQEKFYLVQCFRLLFLYADSLDKRYDVKLTKECYDFVYEIVQKNFTLNYSMIVFAQQIVKYLIKFSRLSDVLEIILDASKIYAKDIDESSIHLLAKFYSWVIEEVNLQSKQPQLSASLNSLILHLDFKSIPSFGIFLLFCINQSNRKKLLKCLISCLKNINYQAKTFILSKFYKQTLKLQEFGSISKKKFLMKKDLRNSKTIKSLDEIKLQLNYQGKITHFYGIFKEKLNKKVIKMSQCCEIYSSKKHLEPPRQNLQ